jgi:hypothetical protein
MKSTFLERNKKKSILAALLLFIRQRKILVLLLLLVVVASGVFLSPSAWITKFPGGTRFVAGVAWMADRMGVDTTQWGIDPGRRRNFRDLMMAFQSAKETSGILGSAGWGAFFSRSSTGAGSGQNSLDFVKGSKNDLGPSGNGSGKVGDGATSVRGIVTAEETAADKESGAVALNADDLKGEREGFVKTAFAGGFFGGLFGGSAASGGAGGAGGLSGGAFASQGFFGGPGGAVTPTSSQLAHGGLGNTPPIVVPKSVIVGGAKGKLSGARSSAIEARSMAGAAKAGSTVGTKAFGQLAQGNGRAMLVNNGCTTGNCPVPSTTPNEYAATNTGAIYDGNAVDGLNTSIITTPSVDVGALAVPDAGMAQNYVDQANQMQADAKTCQAMDDQYRLPELNLQKQMEATSKQFAARGCGSGGCDQSKLDACNGYAADLRNNCNAFMTLRCQHTQSCPLTSTPGTTCPDPASAAECSTGDGVHAAPVTTAIAVPTAANGNQIVGTKTDSSKIGIVTAPNVNCANINAQYRPTEVSELDAMKAAAVDYAASACTPATTSDPATCMLLFGVTTGCKCLTASQNFTANCNSLNTTNCQRTQSCPATANQSCASDCSTVLSPSQIDDLKSALP